MWYSLLSYVVSVDVRCMSVVSVFFCLCAFSIVVVVLVFRFVLFFSVMGCVGSIVAPLGFIGLVVSWVFVSFRCGVSFLRGCLCVLGVLSALLVSVFSFCEVCAVSVSSFGLYFDLSLWYFGSGPRSPYSVVLSLCGLLGLGLSFLGIGA